MRNQGNYNRTPSARRGFFRLAPRATSSVPVLQGIQNQAEDGNDHAQRNPGGLHRPEQRPDLPVATSPKSDGSGQIDTYPLTLGILRPIVDEYAGHCSTTR